MKLKLVEVYQGNGKGQLIAAGSQRVLKTSDMVGCIAVCLCGKDTLYMIHSDSNNASGVGKTSLEAGLKALVLDTMVDYKMFLFGGETQASLYKKAEVVQRVLPNASLEGVFLGVDSAYLTGAGQLAPSKRLLAAAMSCPVEELEFVPPTSTFTPG